MRIRMQKQQVPWAMAAGRAMLGPVLIVGERCGWSGLGLAALVAAALFSDIFDGVLARRWQCDTPGVRLFDSMADTVFYVCVAIALWIGQPQLLCANAGFLGALLVLEAVRFGVEFAKFGKPASYHSFLAKAWGLVMAAAVIVVFAVPSSLHARALLPAALSLGIACDLEGLAMSLVLPVWRKDVTGLRAAWQVRHSVQGSRLAVSGRRGRTVFAGRGSVAIAGLLVIATGLWAAAPALALEPGQAAYAGGTAGIAQDTPGVLDMTSATELVFQSKAPGRTGEIAIPYAKIRTFEARNDVVRHLGFLPALGVGLVAARQRRYTLTISYEDASGAMQVAILQVAERDQHALETILRARAPRSCMVTQYSNSCPVARPVPATAPAVAPTATPATAMLTPAAATVTAPPAVK